MDLVTLAAAKSYINKRIDEVEIVTGATPQQAAQIEQNKTNIADLQAEIEDKQPKGDYVKTVNGNKPDATGNVVVATGGNGSGQNPPRDGEDGFSPIAIVTQTADGATISITDKNGTTTATVSNGKDGVDGQDGYTPQKGIDYFDGRDGAPGVDGYTPQKGIDYFDGKDGKDGSPGKDGSDGQPGSDGVSPAVSVSAITGGHRITITDKNGTKTVDVMDGKGGQDGIPGADGNGIKSAVLNADYTLTLTFDDGTTYTSPSIRGATGPAGKDGSAGAAGKDGTDGIGVASIKQTTTSTADGGNNVFTVTLTNGTSATFTVKNGSKGSTGATGATGPAGPAGSDATVTAESIAKALGYVPVGAGTDSPLTGKKIVYDGDSICAAAFGYPKLIADKTACIFDNQAVGGARLCAVSDKHSVVNNLANLPTDGDIYCFEGGINDWWANTPVGTFSQGDYTGAVDATTIYGAMETICRYALTNFFGKAVCFVIVHKVQNAAYSKNTAGNTFWDYRKAMIDVCEKYSIPYYDAFTKSGLNGWNAAQKAGLFVSGDGTHPNEAAYEAYYVPQLISLFESIVPVGDYEAPAKPVTYTNVLKTAVGTDGQPYNGGKGWKADTYLSYDGRTESSSTNYDVTGWIPAKIGDVIRLKNVQLCKTVGTASKCIVATVKSDFSALASTGWLTAPSAFSEAWKVVTNEAGTDVIQFTVPTSLQASLSYIRLCCGALTDASIITINEEID